MANSLVLNFLDDSYAEIPLSTIKKIYIGNNNHEAVSYFCLEIVKSFLDNNKIKYTDSCLYDQYSRTIYEHIMDNTILDSFVIQNKKYYIAFDRECFWLDLDLPKNCFPYSITRQSDIDSLSLIIKEFGYTKNEDTLEVLVKA